MKINRMRKSLLPLVFVALVGGGVYLVTGSPGHLPGAVFGPSVQALDVNGREVTELQNQYTAFFSAAAGSRDEWQALAVELSAQNSQNAPTAFIKAASLSEAPAERIFLLGAAAEHLMRMDDGRVSEPARGIFKKILALDANDPGALFYLGLEARQRTDTAAIQSYWSQFASVAPENHPLQAMVRNELSANGIQLSDDGIRRTQFDRIAALPEEERRNQIDVMVQGLDARLRANGGTGEEWRQLARSYLQLGRLDEAGWAYDQAIAAAPKNALIILERKQLEAGVQ